MEVKPATLMTYRYRLKHSVDVPIGACRYSCSDDHDAIIERNAIERNVKRVGHKAHQGSFSIGVDAAT
jgi:hypothetical protein